MELMVSNQIEFVYGKGKRKTDIQRWYDLFMGFYTKLNEYEYWLHIIGEERNSCSKTDHDATMCATKIDYYCNTGLSRLCYNAQIAVSDGIIVNADLFQRPADTGYGSYDNYMYCVTHKIELYMKYTMYAKKNEPKFRKKIFNPINWRITEEGYKICPEEHVFNQHVGEHYEENEGYLKIKQKVTSKEKCERCSNIGECCKSKKHQKVISRDEVLDEFYQTVDENLSTEFGKELKKQRSIQVEGAFGVIKQNRKFTRFTRRGLENTKMEFLIVCIGYNLKKYHRYRLKENKDNRLIH